MTFTPCNVDTPRGPCTMVKGHKAKFHRHIDRHTIEWTIKDETGARIEKGRDKVPLGYAINRALDKKGSIIVYVERIKVQTPL